MYNNFSSKKTKKVISALLASALVVTAAPISAEAATTKVLGVKKTFTVKKTTKVSGLSKAEKKIVKVSVNKKKRKVTVKGVKPGKATFKIGSKTYNVKVGSTSVAVKAGKKTMTVGQYTNVKATGKNGAKDTIVFTSSNSKVVAVNSAKKATKTANSKGVASVKATAKKAGTVTITAASKYTGKKVKIKLTVKAATTTTATPEVTATATATGGAATATPEVTATATATATATTNPTATGNAATATPEVPSGSATTAPTATGSATTAPSAVPTVDPSATPTTAPTQTPEVVSASVVSATAVNTQDQETGLDAVTKNGSIKVTFSETVKNASVNNTTFKVTDANGKNISLPASDVKLNPGGKTATVDLRNVGLDKKATYTLTVEGVQTATGDGVKSYKITFTIANVAVIQAIRLDGASLDDELDTNMNNSLNGGSAFDGKTIIVKYDELMDASTINAANIALTNKTTGERIPVTYNTTDPSLASGEIKIETNSTLASKTLYTLTISNAKTAVNGEAESMSHTFTVNGVDPLTGSIDYKTLDAKPIDGTGVKVWPKLTAGYKEDIVNGDIDQTYYAGIQINVTVQENLDAQSVQENVILVEKETKEIVDTTITYNEAAKMIAIVPKAELKEAVDYEIQYLGGLKTTDNVYLKANKKTEVVDTKTKGFTTMDATAPEVTEIVSKSGTTAFEISKAHEFVVKFSETVDIATVPTRVLITESSVNIETDSRSSAVSNYTVTPVAGTDDKEYVVKINAGALQPDKAYKLRVLGKDAKDYAITAGNGNIVCDGENNFMQKTAVYTFSTELDTTAPKLVNVFEGDDITDASKIVASGTKTNVKENDEFTFLFDEKIAFGNGVISVEKNDNGSWKPTSDVSVATSLIANKDSENVAVKVTLADGATSQFQDAKYRIVFGKDAVKDFAPDANAVAEFRYEFVGTVGNDTSADVAVKASTNKQGHASDIDINNGATAVGVNVESRLFIVLNETKTTGVTAANLTVKDADGNVVEGEVKEVTDSIYTGKTVYAFIPTKQLSYETKYTVTIDGVKDVIGNTIEKKEVTFKTQAQGDRVSSVSIADNATSVNRTPKITIKLNNKLGDNDLTATNSDPSAIEYRVAIKDLSNPNTEQYVDTTEYSLTANDDKNEYTIKFNKKDSEGAIKALDANTKYQLIITLDTEESKVVTSKTTFTTGYDANDVLIPELQSIDIAGVKAAKDAITTIDVAKGTTLVMTYDEKLKKDDLKAEITNVSETTSIATVVNPTLSDDGTILTLPTVGLTDEKTYKVVISGLTDTEGNVADTVTFYLVCNTAEVAKIAAAEAAVKAYENKYTADAATTPLDSSTNIATAIAERLNTSSGLRKNAQDEVDKLADKTSLQSRIDDVDTAIETAATVKTVELKDSGEVVENTEIPAVSSSTKTLTVVAKNADGVELNPSDFVGVAGYEITYAAAATGVGETVAVLTAGESSGTLTLQNNTGNAYETTDSWTVTVTATQNSAVKASAAVTVTIPQA